MTGREEGERRRRGEKEEEEGCPRSGERNGNEEARSIAQERGPGSENTRAGKKGSSFLETIQSQRIYPSIRRGEGIVATIYHHPRFPYFSSTRASRQTRTHAWKKRASKARLEGERRRRKRNAPLYRTRDLSKARDFYGFRMKDGARSWKRVVVLWAEAPPSSTYDRVPQVSAYARRERRTGQEARRRR